MIIHAEQTRELGSGRRHDLSEFAVIKGQELNLDLPHASKHSSR